MRTLLATLLVFISAACASAQTPAPAATPSTGGALASVDVPMTGAPQTVHIIGRTFQVAEATGFHRHDGVEMAMVISGEVQVTERGGSVKVYRAGESFVVQRGVVHEGRNVGNGQAQLAVTYILDKGAPLRVAVP